MQLRQNILSKILFFNMNIQWEHEGSSKSQTFLQRKKMSLPCICDQHEEDRSEPRVTFLDGHMLKLLHTPRWTAGSCTKTLPSSGCPEAKTLQPTFLVNHSRRQRKCLGCVCGQVRIKAPLMWFLSWSELTLTDCSRYRMTAVGFVTTWWGKGEALPLSNVCNCLYVTVPRYTAEPKSRTHTKNQAQER